MIERAKRYSYTRGDKVWWWGEVEGKKNRSKAIFVRYDESFPDEDAILAIKIWNYKHSFRWPLRLTAPVR